MISLTVDQWINICEEYLDDSAGAVDVPDFDVTIDDSVVLTFNTPKEETFFRLRFLKETQ
jgi:hypothetical protein